MDTTSFKRVLDFVLCLEMLVNMNQYWGSAGMFNNCNFVFRPKFTDPIGHKCLSTNHLYFKLYLPMFPMNLVLLLVFVIVVLWPRCSFYTTSRNTYASILVITIAILFDYLSFAYNLLLLCGDVELNPEPN